MMALTNSCKYSVYGRCLPPTNMTRWIGRDAVPALLADVFGVEDRTQLKQGKASLPVLDNEYSERVRAGELILLGEDGTGCLTLCSCGKVSRSQVKGSGIYHTTYAIHYQGRWRPKSEVVGTNIACGRPSRPGREYCAMDKQASGKGVSMMSAHARAEC